MTPIQALDGFGLDAQFFDLWRGYLVIGMFTAGEQLVGNAGKSVDIVTRIGIHTCKHLRRRIGWSYCTQFGRIKHGVFSFFFGLSARSGDTKIEQFNVTVIEQKTVTGFEVGMNQQFFMCVSEAAAEFFNNVQRMIQLEWFFAELLDQFIEGFTLQILHCHEDCIVVAVEIINGRYVRMRKALCFTRFTLQGDERTRILLESIG